MFANFTFFVFQSFMLAMMAGGLGAQLFQFVDDATKLAHLPKLHAAVNHYSSAFLVVAGIAWLAAEINLVRASLTEKARTTASDENWLPVFAPIMMFLGWVLLCIFCGGIGLLAAGVAHLLVSEELSWVAGLTVVAAIVSWGISASISLSAARKAKAD
jgi:hypothetical protein